MDIMGCICLGIDYLFLWLLGYVMYGIVVVIGFIVFMNLLLFLLLF